MTTNFDFVKSMTVQELAAFINKSNCNHCKFLGDTEEDCGGKDCIDGIAEWLEEKRA